MVRLGPLGPTSRSEPGWIIVGLLPSPLPRALAWNIHTVSVDGLLSYWLYGMKAVILCTAQFALHPYVRGRGRTDAKPISPGVDYGPARKPHTTVDLSFPGLRSVVNAHQRWSSTTSMIFVTLGSPGSQECGGNLEKILVVCANLGVPLAIDKLEGPVDRLTFLGIELDTESGVMRLPAEKLSRLRDLVAEEVVPTAAVGIVNRVVRPGRAFLRLAPHP